MRLNTGRPPFRLIGSQSPGSVACDMVAAFSAVSRLPEKVDRTFSVLASLLGLPAGAPLRRAGHAIARAMDSGSGCALPGDYHDAQHSCEVMLAAHYLCLLERLAENESAQVVVAALFHDFQHTGPRNAQVPFHLERRAVGAAMPYLEQAGVAADERQTLAALVLATEPHFGVPFAKACRAGSDAGAAPPAPPPGAPELALLYSGCCVRAVQATILCAADVLPSVALTVEHALLLQDKLAREWGRPLGLADKLAFVQGVIGQQLVDEFFQPNIRRLRDALRERLDRQARS